VPRATAVKTTPVNQWFKSPVQGIALAGLLFLVLALRHYTSAKPCVSSANSLTSDPKPQQT